MTAKEVCDFLGISIATLNRRVADGELTPLPKSPGVKKVHERKFDKAQIVNYKPRPAQN